jgi:RNA polymerase sigma-70 factor (ECF subfamily)
VKETQNIETRELVMRLQKGDKNAFEELYDTYASSLYGLVCKIIHSEETARDLLQDIFVKIWEHICLYNFEKGSLFTWMLNIARNTSIDKLRKLKKEGKAEILSPDILVSIDKEQHHTIKTSFLGLKELVERLSPEQKILIEYIYFNGYTQQEVADELGIPLGTVKTRTRNAVNELRKVFLSFLLWM